MDAALTNGANMKTRYDGFGRDMTNTYSRHVALMSCLEAATAGCFVQGCFSVD